MSPAYRRHRKPARQPRSRGVPKRANRPATQPRIIPAWRAPEHARRPLIVQAPCRLAALAEDPEGPVCDRTPRDRREGGWELLIQPLMAPDMKPRTYWP
jgi:hypothetical protein